MDINKAGSCLLTLDHLSPTETSCGAFSGGCELGRTSPGRSQLTANSLRHGMDVLVCFGSRHTTLYHTGTNGFGAVFTMRQHSSRYPAVDGCFRDKWR